MSNIYYDEVEIEDMLYDSMKQMWTYPCPCGDRFILTLDQFNDGEEIAKCPSCSLIIKIIYSE
jgi:diphthamide biosynthesis protein 3